MHQITPWTDDALAFAERRSLTALLAAVNARTQHHVIGQQFEAASSLDNLEQICPKYSVHCLDVDGECLGILDGSEKTRPTVNLIPQTKTQAPPNQSTNQKIARTNNAPTTRHAVTNDKFKERKMSNTAKPP